MINRELKVKYFAIIWITDPLMLFLKGMRLWDNLNEAKDDIIKIIAKEEKVENGRIGIINIYAKDYEYGFDKIIKGSYVINGIPKS